MNVHEITGYGRPWNKEQLIHFGTDLHPESCIWICLWIWTKLSGRVDHGTRINRLDLWTDPNPGFWICIWIFSIFQNCKIWHFLIVSSWCESGYGSLFFQFLKIVNLGISQHFPTDKNPGSNFWYFLALAEVRTVFYSL